MAAVMVSIFAVATNLTIVNVALPRIVSDLGGLDLFAWPVTSYLLASTAPVPLAGKLGDVFGRKPLVVVGLVIFIGGTAITGLAASMEQLIVFRAVQGIGGGLIMAAAFTTVGDFFAPADRGRWQGLFAGVFALSLVIAPLVGGTLTDYLSWRWVFFVNLPVAAIALVVVLWGMPWFRPRQRRPIDYRGGLLLIAAAVPLLLGLSWAGNQYGWTEAPVLIAVGIGAAAILLFLLFERRRPDGVLPLSLFRNRVFVVSALIAATVGVGMFGVMQFVPLFIQGVQGESATNSGTVTMPMGLGIVIGAALTGQIMSRGLPYRPLAVGGALTASLGIFLLSSLSADSSTWPPRGYMVVFGLGMGAMLPLITVAVQNALPYRLMGVGTASMQFFRQIGGTLGVAVFGSLMFATLATGLGESTLPGIDVLRDRPQILLDPDALSGFRETLDARIPGASAPAIAATRVALGDAITNLFQIAGGVMALAAVVALFLPQPRLRTREELLQQARVGPTPILAAPSPALVLGGVRAPQHGAGRVPALSRGNDRGPVPLAALPSLPLAALPSSFARQTWRITLAMALGALLGWRLLRLRLNGARIPPARPATGRSDSAEVLQAAKPASRQLLQRARQVLRLVPDRRAPAPPPSRPAGRFDGLVGELRRRHARLPRRPVRRRDER